MQYQRLTRNEKLSATMQLQNIEVALSHVLFEVLNSGLTQNVCFLGTPTTICCSLVITLHGNLVAVRKSWNCNIALADQDCFVWLADKVREFRYKVEGYREIEDRGVRL